MTVEELLNYHASFYDKDLSQKRKELVKLLKIDEKKKIEDLKCFMVKLPSFSDVKEFNESLIEIEAWFEKNK